MLFNVSNDFTIHTQRGKKEGGQLHGGFSPQWGRQPPARFRQLGPRIGSRWGRCENHHHRWRRGDRRPRQLEAGSLAKEALRPPPPSTPLGCHWSRRPPGCHSFTFIIFLIQTSIILNWDWNPQLPISSTQVFASWQTNLGAGEPAPIIIKPPGDKKHLSICVFIYVLAW